ncbi:hypothetical protein GCM10027195_03210 [Comamonas sediminis]
MNNSTKITTLTPGRSEDMAVQLEVEMADILREDLGMTASEAADKAQAVVRGMRKRMGGNNWYVPVLLDKQARDEAIRREFSGPNSLPGLKRKYGLTERRIYQIARAKQGH